MSEGTIGGAEKLDNAKPSESGANMSIAEPVTNNMEEDQLLTGRSVHSANNADVDQDYGEDEAGAGDPFDLPMAVLMRKAHTNLETFKYLDSAEEKTVKKVVGSDPNALYLFSMDSYFRQKVREIVGTKYFDWVILVVIVVNCVFLVLDDNPPRDSDRGRMFFIAETFFTVAFTIEFVLKVIALGFFVHPSSYLRDSWNRLDFLVVVTGLLSYIEGIELGLIRALRVLRPLKAVKAIPGMRIIVSSLIASISYLVDVAGLFLFLIFIFGILGVQLYGGYLRQRCLHVQSGMWEYEEHPLQLWEPNDQLCSLHTGVGRHCADGFICSTSILNPNSGVTSFDNILIAWVTIFQMITLEGWVDVMYWTQEIDSQWNQLYFIFLVLFGAFFVMNLVVAVIFLRFDQMKKGIEQEKKKKRELDEQKAYVAEHEAARQQAEALKKQREEGLLSPPGEGYKQSFAIVMKGSKDPGAPEGNEVTSDAQTEPSLPLETAEEETTEVWEKTVKNGQLNFFQKKVILPCYHIATSSWFSASIVIMIIVNTIVLAIDWPNMDPDLVFGLNIVSLLLWVIFAVEAVVKIIGLGPRPYFRDGFNCFDCLIVIISFIELVVGGEGGLSVLRTFRLLRVLKVLSLSPNLKALMQVVLLSMEDIGYFSLVFLLFMLIFSILGMQLFRGAFSDSRAHFDDFFWSFVTVFQVVTGENWNEVMYTAIEAKGWASSLYFILMFTLGNYTLLSLFLAIMLGNFDHLEEIKLENDQSKKNGSRVLRKEPEAAKAAGHHKLPEEGELLPEDGAEDSESKRAMAIIVKKKILEELEQREKKDHVPNIYQRIASKFVDLDAQARFNLSQDHSPQVHPSIINVFGSKTAVFTDSSLLYSRHMPRKIETEPTFLYGKSLYLFAPDNIFRRKIAVVCLSNYFETFIMICILISNILLMLDEPNVDPDSELRAFLDVADIVMSSIFIIEMVLKWIAMGVLFTKDAYLHSNWNVLDFFIVMMSIGNFFGGGLGFFKVFRALRSLRALRMVSHMERLRLVVKSIAATFSSLAYVLIIAMLFFTIFAILGVQLFKGGMWRCYDSQTNVVYYNVTEMNCEAASGGLASWTQGSHNFDHFGNALLVLFEVATLEMWPDIMYAVVDRVGEGMPPVEETNPAAAIYFLCFILVGSFFVIGLFVGVVVDEYNKQHLRFTGALKLTSAQKFYLEAYKNMIYSPPEIEFSPSKNRPWRKRIFKLVQKPKFELFIMACIIFNVLVMALTYAGEPTEYAFALSVVNEIFTWIFFVELVLKIIGLGFKQYASSRWNLFDAFIVFSSFVTMILEAIAANSGGDDASLAVDPSTFRMLRIFRVLRMVRLVRSAKGLSQLLRTLVFSAPALTNVGTMLMLLLFMYAIVGMQMFGNAKKGVHLNEHANFDTFWTSMVTLIRMSTGESWNGLMHDSIQGVEGGDTNFIYASILFFYLTFVVFSSFLLLNVFVAVVLKNFEEEVKSDPKNTKCPITREHIRRYGIMWQEHHNGLSMPLIKLQSFLMSLPPGFVLSLDHHLVMNTGSYLRLLHTLDIPQWKLKVHFLDVMLAIATYKLFPGQKVLDAKIDKENESLQGTQTQALSLYPELKSTKRYHFGCAHAMAVIKLQAAYRKRLAKRIAAGYVLPKKQKSKRFSLFNSIGKFGKRLSRSFSRKKDEEETRKSKRRLVMDDANETLNLPRDKKVEGESKRGADPTKDNKQKSSDSGQVEPFNPQGGDGSGDTKQENNAATDASGGSKEMSLPGVVS